MKAKFTLKSFPGHEGIPGHQGGSLPRDAQASNALDHILGTDLANTPRAPMPEDGNMTLHDVTEMFAQGNLLGSVMQIFSTERIPKGPVDRATRIHLQYEDVPNERFPQQWIGKSGVIYQMLPQEKASYTLHAKGFKGVLGEIWTHPNSKVKIDTTKPANGVWYARVYKD